MGRFKKKKSVGQRGGRTHGWGSPKKHRGKGSHGGKGRAGKFGHMMTRILRDEPERIGFKGFNAKTTKKHKCINLRDAGRLAGKEKALDLSRHGYAKLLGKGEIEKALTITVDFCSAKARGKVEAAGGKVIMQEAAPAEAAKGAGAAPKAKGKAAVAADADDEADTE